MGNSMNKGLDSGGGMVYIEVAEDTLRWLQFTDRN